MKYLLFFTCFIFIPACEIETTQTNNYTMTDQDQKALSALNARFIHNFITQDVASHDAIIHPDFVCIEGSGRIVDRDTYLRQWATDFVESGCDTFTHSDEHIRIFGNTALVRSRTTCTRTVEGRKVDSYTVYTDTYIKENGIWKCIQAQMTPIRAPQ